MLYVGSCYDPDGYVHQLKATIIAVKKKKKPIFSRGRHTTKVLVAFFRIASNVNGESAEKNPFSILTVVKTVKC